jgi:hypothetical protein
MILGDNKKPLTMNINFQDATDVVCPYCEKNKLPDEPSQNIFIQAFIIKKISALQSPTGKEGLVPLPIFICQMCGLQVTADENIDI